METTGHLGLPSSRRTREVRWKLFTQPHAALDVAARGVRGANPLVGAALLWDDGTFTTGYHQGEGAPHAEPDVIRNASPRSTTGATLIVTLEPCSHTGRTGPCTQAIINAGITRVVIASRDPNPQASGGAQILTEAGVEVIFLNDLGQSWAHELATHAHNLNARRFTAVTHNRPFITAKIAQSLDGCVAAHDRTSQWITGAESRAHAHLTRARVDAIAVGTGTAHADNPRLTARTGGGSDADWQAGTDTQLGAPHQPSPVVFDDEDRENEGDLIMPAHTATPEWMGFMVRHTSGVICVPMLPERATELDLRPMVANNQDPTGTAYTVSCDAAAGVSTGISFADRAHTANLLANPGANTSDFTRPGHMFPLIAKPGGCANATGTRKPGSNLRAWPGAHTHIISAGQKLPWADSAVA
ncbi:MAG TPA: bifunctional diaminohydroxyphosphoribosylaminopyrimidine deaminase/5-amino-6-(5-phosphoribosylamino)uracil reductase RibD [Brevibacterium ravenspurgense]|nr:bifunctional diaminohydroxyphosphoribosylaminopyrimidine deaminase/5-amino-6-(5-phosphoribosylamino)uracil reductase RibD [Brevibacterium ravenspurgense]